MTARCHVCGLGEASDLLRLPHGVTSDCRPFGKPVTMFCCTRCGASQAPITPEWEADVAEIYRSYDTYAAAGGNEQRVAQDGGMQARSAALVAGILPYLAKRGEALDVGCGRGAFLEALYRELPCWGLHGTEFDDRQLPLLEQIPGFRGLQTGPLEQLRGSFDLVSMVHVLEHLQNPAVALGLLREHARPGCQLLVQVPDWQENPFALAIADHATHFSPEVLLAVARAGGWPSSRDIGRPVPKELSLLAAAGDAAELAGAVPAREAALLRSRVDWLKRCLHAAREAAEGAAEFGLFGTAIAATWLKYGLGDCVRFFVDEDPNRAGRTHLGLPILRPDEVPAGADVFVGMAPLLSGIIAAKCARQGVTYHGVPELGDE